MVNLYCVIKNLSYEGNGRIEISNRLSIFRISNAKGTFPIIPRKTGKEVRMSTAREVEYLAEMELVTIIPKFNLPPMTMIYGDVGPFRAGMPVQVPLWIAINFRTRSKCLLVPPDWLNVTTLEILKREEIASKLFTKMPSEHYMVVSKLIFASCAIDVPDADACKVLVKDIWDTRIAKLRTSVHFFLETGAMRAKVDNLTQLEIVSVRPFLPHALEQLFRIHKTLEVTFNHTQSLMEPSGSRSRND